MPIVRWPLWFVVPCYAMVGWKSLISGDFPSDQGTGPEQQGTIWKKNDSAGYALAEPRHIRVKCGAGQSAACVQCLNTKGTLICRGATRVYPVKSFAL